VSLSAERIAIANRAVCSTFERTSIVWQAVPHWDVGDPGRINVRTDAVFQLAAIGAAPPPFPTLPAAPLGGPAAPLQQADVQFQLTLAQATADTPDALLAAVIPRSAELAQQFDNAILPALAAPAAAGGGAGAAAAWYTALPAPLPLPAVPNAPAYLAALINAREVLEGCGYPAASCLIAGNRYFINLAQWVGSNVATEGLLVGANANSLYRTASLNAGGGAGGVPHRMLMIGRRQQIEQGGAATASAGEEAVDIAISVAPSLEVVGEAAGGLIDVAVRIRYLTRFKDERGIVVFHDP
jgi:hypothetical protein